jgi:hypothetical protein
VGQAQPELGHGPAPEVIARRFHAAPPGLAWVLGGAVVVLAAAARPDTLVGLMVSDVEAVEAEFGRPTGEPPYGCEFELRDPDGNRLRIRGLVS